MLGGGETVSVTVLVLVLVLTDGLDAVVSVLVDGVVVSVLVDVGWVVWVTVWVGATSGADVEVVAVVVVVVSVLSEESEIRLTDNHTMRATRSAISAPKATSAAGLRYQASEVPAAARPAVGDSRRSWPHRRWAHCPSNSSGRLVHIQPRARS